MRFCGLCLTLILASPVWAAQQSKNSDDAPDKVFTVSVPKSEIALEPIRYVPQRPAEIALSVSNWLPSNFTRGSYAGQVSQFEASSIPALNVLRYADIASFKNGIMITSKLGLGYLDLQRSGTRVVGNATEGSSTENMNLFIGHFGVEAAWTGLLKWGLEPDMSLSVLPTFGLAQDSIFEGNVSAFGLPYEATLGMMWRPYGISRSSRGAFSFGISGQVISGNVGGSSMTGYGVEGELRISL